MAQTPVQQYWSPEFARSLRRRYLELALRRARPGTGSSWSLFQQRDWSPLKLDLSRLRTPFVVVGAVATRLYMPERVTSDTDILIHSREEPRADEELKALGFTLDARLSLGGASWFAENGERLDVLALDDPWVDDALARANRSPDGLPVIALPYLVLLKMNASRGLDFGDLTRMLGLGDEKARDEIRAVVRAYQPEDLEDLESMIVLGDLEFGAFRASQ